MNETANNTTESITLDYSKLTADSNKYKFVKYPEESGWKCYMFGSSPNTGYGMVYNPSKGNVPNWFVRWMMKICLGCTWVKEEN